MAPTPAEVVRHVCDLLEQRRWNEVADWIDPQSLEEWHESRLQSLRYLGSPRILTAEEYSAHDPEMPIEVAQWLTDRHNRTAQEQKYSEFGENADPVQLESLSASELLGCWLEANDPRAQVRMAILSQAPIVVKDLIPELPFERRQVVGELIADDYAYVPYLTGQQPRAMGIVNLAVLRRTGGAWRLLLGGELFHHGSMAVAVQTGGTRETPFRPGGRSHGSNVASTINFRPNTSPRCSSGSAVQSLGWCMCSRSRCGCAPRGSMASGRSRNTLGT